jgi:UDP-N-acetylmuramoyl-L-alanyl-D-glutamate--2,6-diaminopimelate ligase
MARWFVDRRPERGIPSVSLRRLLPQAQFLGCRDLIVSGCSADSRRLEPGEVFVALPRHGQDGQDNIARAIERGAVGVIAERPSTAAGALQVIVADSRDAHARLAQALAGGPSEVLPIFAVSGHRGRTATACFLRAILEARGGRIGLVGDHGWSDGVNSYPAGQSEPGAVELAEMFLAMGERGCAGGILEVSPAILTERSIAGMHFAAAIVTDLPGSSITLERRVELRRAHAPVMRAVVAGGISVVNADDREAELLGAVNLKTRRVSFGTAGSADVSAAIEGSSTREPRVSIRGLGRQAVVRLRPPGSQHALHAAAAAAVAWSLGFDAEQVAAGLESVDSITGQIERVNEGQDFGVWIDPRHDAGALRETLDSLRSRCAGKIHCVLTVDGDSASWPELAFVAENAAVRLVLTVGGPVGEGNDILLDGLLACCRRPGLVRVEPDRRAAIEAALGVACTGDAVLIAGGGRKCWFEPGTRPTACGDRSLAVAWLRRHRQRSWRLSA